MLLQYVFVLGLPKSTLSELVVTPQELLRRGNSYRINATYYIEKCINPALIRLLSLCGADILSWYKSMTKPKLRRRYINYDNLPATLIETSHVGYDGIQTTADLSGYNAVASIVTTRLPRQLKQTSMDIFTIQNTCIVCDVYDAVPKTGLCQGCSKKRNDSLIVMFHRLNISTNADNHLMRLCLHCSRSNQSSQMFSKGEMIGQDSCESLDCSIFFERCRIIARIEDVQVSMSDLT